MSYDLHFWKQTQRATGRPSELLHQLLEGLPVPEVEPLPLAGLLSALQDALPGCNADHATDLQQLEWRDESRSLLIGWSESLL